ncbi:MAG: YtxH domain-containing protein [Balneolaceae bacterium]|nr:MAG: YtxH domain-containing protein [Balneolaceae bacterium]
MDDKTKAIVSHITLIGWIVALVLNQGDNKTELASFYIRQMLGLFLLVFVLGLIPIVNLVAWILGVVLWILSLIGSLNGEKKLTPVVGEYFQDWFKAL